MVKKKVISIEDRIPKLKQARKKRANRRLIYYLSAFFLLISLIVYLQSPLSKVKTFIISGNELLSEEELVELSGIKPKSNMWWVDSKESEEKLTDSPYIETATINRKFPRSVEITIKEFNLVGYTLKGKNYFPVLGNGVTLSDPVKTMNGKVPLLHGFDEAKRLTSMTKELDMLEPGIRNMISEIYWEPTEENKDKVTLYMKQGYIVKGEIIDFANKMDIYPSIISQLEPGQKGTIHIGIGAYFEQTKDD